MFKKIMMVAAGIAVACASASAQREWKETQVSEARVLELNPSTYVKPLVAEVQVDTQHGRVRDTWHLDPAELASRRMRNDAETLNNLRAWGVFKSSEAHSCDIIVAATFDIRIDREGADITVVGYPANFANWSSSTKSDYDWIRFEKGYTEEVPGTHYPRTEKPDTNDKTPQKK